MSTMPPLGLRPPSPSALLLVGNPNVGKSVFFGYLTGRYVNVSNYPGTTVEVTCGRPTRAVTAEIAVPQVMDTPGVNTLIPLSEEERVTRDMLLDHPSAIAVQVADAKNLRRALVLTLELAELEIPLVLALNLMDELRARGIEVDGARLGDELGVTVVPTVATRRSGMSALLRSLPRASVPKLRVRYAPAVEAAVARIAGLLPPGLRGRRGIALMLAAGDATLRLWVQSRLAPAAHAEMEGAIADLERRLPGPPAQAIHRARLARADRLLVQTYAAPAEHKASFAALLGRWSMHPVWGLGILAAVLIGMYEFVGVFGAGILVAWFENGLFARVIHPVAFRLADLLVPVALLRDVLVGEYGVITMALTYGIAIVLPIVGTFFVAFSILEDSGYLPRLAVMVNRIFQGMGLNGKAVLPMVLGLGCDTMATLTTRILDRPKERVIVTLLLALGVPCSAQLGVIFAMLGQAGLAAAALWGAVVLGVLFLVGYLAARVLPGEIGNFVIELPPMRVPQLGNILVKTLARIEWYLREALPLFVVGTLVLFALDALDLLAVLENGASPVVVGLLGLPAAAAQAFVLGFLRRDYGAAGFFKLQQEGLLDPLQTLVALVTMTLFVPCIANFFMMIKERGLRTSLLMAGFIFPFALAVGALLNHGLRGLGVTFGAAP
jgi:ferrous iron transport protein B